MNTPLCRFSFRAFVSISVILFGHSLISGCTSQPTQTNLQKSPQKLERSTVYSDSFLYRSIDQGKLRTNKVVALGGLSDLIYSARDSRPGFDVYYTLTDRGPNGSSEDRNGDGFNERTFLVPEFTPQILKLVVNRNTREVKVESRILLSLPKGRTATGLPNVDPRSGEGTTDEIPVRSDLSQLGFDPWGLDPEGLARDEIGNFWVAEEYGPSLVKVDPRGRILKRFLPKDSRITSQDQRKGERVLPEILTYRQENRGIEAIAKLPDGNLLLFLQSPPKGLAQNWAPVVEFDTVRERAVGLYFYPMDSKGGKIGAATVLPNGEVLVLEQNGKLGQEAFQAIFAISVNTATNLIDAPLVIDGKILIPEKNNPLQKSLFMDLVSEELAQVEKLEGLAANGAGQIILVNDNDFQPEIKGRFETQSNFFFLNPTQSQ